jgi:hypothetical protein
MMNGNDDLIITRRGQIILNQISALWRGEFNVMSFHHRCPWCEWFSPDNGADLAWLKRHLL